MAAPARLGRTSVGAGYQRQLSEIAGRGAGQRVIATTSSGVPGESDARPIETLTTASSPTVTSAASIPSGASSSEPAAVAKLVVSRVVHAVIDPFGADDGPSTPADIPGTWTLLAFARREFDPSATPASASMTPFAAQQAMSSAPLTLATVFDAVETAVNTVFNTSMRVIEGPPALPPGSTVTVATAPLQLPCDTAACTVSADWYFPAGSNPQGIIYFQHGAIANPAMYSYTAATLAEETNCIVVAPTMPTFYTTDGYWLGGAPMQQAVADLFVGDRAALTASASAAAGHPITLPQKVIFVGHSEGGGLAVGAADDMAKGPDAADLAGVIMLDGSTLDRTLIANAAHDIPSSTPILLIASEPSFWNQLGATASDLATARPGTFTGVQLTGGTHADAVSGGNPLIQAIEQVVAGPSQPQNVDAVTTLASGWINDMLSPGPDTGIYGTPGQTVPIPTGNGTAFGTVLPAPPVAVSPVDVVLDTVITFGTETFYDFAGSLRYVVL